MKRIAAGLALVALCVGGFYMLMASLVSADNARIQVTNALAGWSGSRVLLSERVDLRIFPAPRLTLYDLSISGSDDDQSDNFISAEVLSADIRILPLLIGRVSFKTLELSKPKITFLRNAKGQRDWRFDGSSAAVQLALTGGLPVERLALTDGIIEYHDVTRKEQDTIEVREFSLDWSSLHQPATLRGTVSRNDAAFSFDVRVADPVSFFERKSTPFTMMLDGDLINAQLEGELTDYKAVQFAGNLDASGSSLRQLIRLTGGKVPEGPALGPFSVRGKAEIKPKGLFVDQGEVELDGNVASGSMQLNLAEGTKLVGTLAFQSLDLTPYLALLGGTGPEHWSKHTINTNWFDDLDADLRLSADRIVAGRYELGSAAASAFLSERQLQVGVAESAFYGGTISGTISVADLPKKAGQKIAVQLRAAEFDLGSAVKLAGISQRVSGNATMTVDLATSGASLGEQFHNTEGSFAVRSVSGEIPDLGIAYAWQALSTSAGMKGDGTNSASTYRRLDVDGTLNRRVVVLENVSLDSGAYTASLKGTFRMADQTVALAGHLAAHDDHESGARFSIDGRLSEPWLTMDPAQDPSMQPRPNQGEFHSD